VPLPASRPAASRATSVAIGALLLAAAALVVGALTYLRPGPTLCQASAWDALPAAGDLPSGWTIGSTDYYRDSQTTTLAGPDPGDGSGGANLYVSVTCFGADAADAVARSRASATEAGRPVTDLEGMGDGGYEILNSSAGSGVLYFHRATLAAYLASQGTVSDAELRTAGNAVDKAMQRALAGTGRVPGTARPAGSAAPSAAPSEAGSARPAASGAASASASPVAPQLEALLPVRVGTTSLARNSATGDMVLGTDAGSRALVAALTSLGKQATDLEIAQAYDEAGSVDLSILGFRVPGISASKLKPIVLQTWLFADATGVSSSEVTLGGRKATKVSYGDAGTSSYVVTSKDAVIVVETADAKLAAEALAALP
jgi:hypothetical protein